MSYLQAFGPMALVACMTTGLLVASADAQEKPEKSATPSPASAPAPTRPTFRTPSELDEPPGLVISRPPTPPAPTPGAASVAPPAVVAGEKATPPVEEPTTAPEPPEENTEPGSVLHAPPRTTHGVYLLTRGFYFEAAPSELLAKQSGFAAALESTAEPPSALIYARGYYAFLSDRHADRTGVEVVADVNLYPGVQAGAMFHHELREYAGSYGAINLLFTLDPSLYLASRVGVGTNAYFLPTTEVASELRGVVPGYDFLQWGVGGGASWWTQDRRRYHGVLSATVWFGHELMAELRQLIGVIDARGRRAAAVTVHSLLGALYGTQGKAMAQLRFGIGTAPSYRTDGDWASTPIELFLEGSLGARYWIGDHYGIVGTVEGGGEIHNLFRIGADVAIFLEL